MGKILRIAGAFLKGFQAGAPVREPKNPITKREAFSQGFALRQTMASNWAEKKAALKSNLLSNVKATGGKSNSLGKNVIANLKSNAIGMAKSSQSNGVMFPSFQMPRAPKIKPPRLF